MDIQAVNQGVQNHLEAVSKNNTPEIQPVTQNQNISKEANYGDIKQEQNIKKAVDKLNKFLEGEVTHVEYERHEKLKNQFMVKIINNKTKEVIKEIPSKKILDMVAEMCKMAGVMLDEKA